MYLAIANLRREYCEHTSVPTIFYVKDNGIGIGKKHSESIFRIFKRLYSLKKCGSTTEAGLAIAKKIVERRGQIGAESEYGSSIIFYFTLQLAA